LNISIAASREFVKMDAPVLCDLKAKLGDITWIGHGIPVFGRGFIHPSTRYTGGERRGKPWNQLSLELLVHRVSSENRHALCSCTLRGLQRFIHSVTHPFCGEM